MILDRIENANIYSCINEGIKKVLDIAKDIAPENYPTEILYLDGENLFINFAAYQTRKRSDAMSEAHRKYIDVMYMVEGCETIYVKNVNALQKITQEYDPAKDLLFADLDDDTTPVRLEKGSFVILFPEDSHAPACDPAKDSKVAVKKIIGKVLL